MHYRAGLPGISTQPAAGYFPPDLASAEFRLFYVFTNWVNDDSRREKDYQVMPAPDLHSKRIASSPLGLVLIWLLIASSSVVQIQPAPYDGMVIVLLLGFLAMGLRVPSRIFAPALLLGLFLLANLISALRIPEPSLDFDHPGLSILALPTRIHLVFTWVLFVSIVYEDPVRVFNAIWKGYFVATIIAVIFGAGVYYRLFDAGSWGETLKYPDRVRGTFEDPNVYGPFVVVATVYLVATMENASRTTLLLKTVLFGALSWGILLSYSRGAWANFIISLGVFLSLRILTARTETHQLKVLLLSVTLVLGATGGFASLILSGKMDALFFERAQLFQPYDLREGGRFDTQGEALEQVLSDPLGVGPGQAKSILGLEPHNLYLIVPIETGWLGGIALYGFILLTLWRSFRFCLQPTPLQHTYAVIFACTVGVTLESLVIDTTHWRHMYLLWGMLWGPLLAWESTRDRLADLLPRRAVEASRLT